MTDFHVPMNVYLERYAHKHAALYHALKDTIVSGRLPYGTRLPSSRQLGALYELSRGVVSQVYERLASEGYVVSEVGRGTYAAFHPNRPAETFTEPGGKGEPQDERVRLELSEWGKRVAELPLRTSSGEPGTDIQFAIGYNDAAAFPSAVWNRALYAQVRGMNSASGDDKFAALGHLPLREAIGRHLQRMRGIAADPSAIAVVNGSMQAIALLAMLLIEPGQPVVVENPGYSGIWRAIAAAGGRPLAAVVDGKGIVPDDWEARLAFVTPARQFPTGAVLSLERRQRLLAWARERRAILIEDDYDSEFRHRGRPIEPLKALDREGRVVYIGTFTRTMMHHFRIGYAVLPDALVEPFARARQLFEPHPTPLVEQRALAAFMNDGEYERHLRRMGRIYSRKFELVRTQLEEQLEPLFELSPTDANLHLYARWRRTAGEYEDFRQTCADAGVTWTDGSGYVAAGGPPSACFGFAHLSESEIVRGIALMKGTADRLFRSS